MGRAKTKWDLIGDKCARRATFEKRRKGVEKKAHELATLCDVRIGIIMYGPTHGDNSTEPMIWPGNQDLISSMVKAYREKPEEISNCRSSNIVKFYQEKAWKVEEEMKKLKKQNDESKYPTWDGRYEHLSYDEIVRFGDQLEAKLTAVDRKIEFLKGTYGGQVHHQAGPSRFSPLETKPNCGHDDYTLAVGGLMQPSSYFRPLEISQKHPDALMGLEFLEEQTMGVNTIMNQGFQPYTESMFFNSWKNNVMSPPSCSHMQPSYFRSLEMAQKHQDALMGLNFSEEQAMEGATIMNQGFQPFNKSMYFNSWKNNVMSPPSYSHIPMGNEAFENGMFSLDQVPAVLDNNAVDGVHGTPSMYNNVTPMHHPVPLGVPRSLLSDCSPNMLVGSHCNGDNQAMLRYENENR